MRKNIIIKQHDLTDCGPACLLSVIIYYGGYVPLEMLRCASFTDRSGTSAYNLINCAKKYGFSGVGEKVSRIDKIESNKLPCIAHIKKENGLHHFVVIYKINKKSALIMDPATGKVKLPIEKFNLEFGGVIILLHPYTKIIKIDKPKTIKKIIINIITQNKLNFMYLVVLSIFAVLISLFLSYFIKIGTLVISKGKNITIFILLFLLLYIFKNISNYLKNRIIISLNKKISCKIYSDFSNKIFHLPLSFIKSRTSGEIITRYNELSEIANILPNIILSMGLDLIMAFIAIFFSINISFSLSLIVIIFMLIYLALGSAFKNPTLHKVSKNLDETAGFNTCIIDTVNNLRSIKNLSNESNMNKRLNNSCERSLYNNYLLDKYYSNINMIKSFLYDLMIFLVTSYGLLLIYFNKLSIIDLFTFILIINYFTEPIKDLIDMITKFCFLKTSINKINEFSIISEHDVSSKLFISGDILVKNLSFAYNGIDYIIKNYSCLIKNKSKVLLKGDSGSGKSTLCQLISKQLDNYEGKIYIDKNNLNDINSDSLRKNITYIGQKDSLLVDTIENNIKYERKVDNKDFKTICKICEIDKIVNKKFDRFNSLISESSDNISGGEKQRITLARGLINCGKVIILDESLSEVNQDMEERIIKRIIKYFKDKTIIYVSHKDYKEIFDQTIKI